MELKQNYASSGWLPLNLEINRTIMELKRNTHLLSPKQQPRLNRTIMELKWKLDEPLHDGDDKVLIVPLWN